MNVLLVAPMEPPRRVDIENSLESMQAVVGGLIQAVYPFDEPVALVCNDEDKLLGLPLNRCLSLGFHQEIKKARIRIGLLIAVRLQSEQDGKLRRAIHSLYHPAEAARHAANGADYSNFLS